MSRKHFRCAFALVALSLMATAPALSQVFRCTEDGKTVYRDKPCAGVGKSVDIAVPSVAPEDAARARLQSEANMGRLAVGQTPQQVEKAWGTPKKKNIDTGSSGRTEQWVYERPEGTSYVYFRSGVLSSYSQHEEAPGSTLSPPPAPTVPTRAEVEAQERADKAGERKFIRERIHQGAVVARIGEPESKSFGGGIECWYYGPAVRDAQTLTKICFTPAGFVVDVERTVKR